MPGPSERKRRERIEDAFTAVAEEIVKRRESLRAKGKSGSSFRVRIAPTMADYRKGRCGCGGYDPRDADSRDVFFAVVSELEKTCGVEVRRDATGAPESLVANESVVRYAYRKTGRNFDETEVSCGAFERDGARLFWRAVGACLDRTHRFRDGVCGLFFQAARTKRSRRP